MPMRIIAAGIEATGGVLLFSLISTVAEYKFSTEILFHDSVVRDDAGTACHQRSRIRR